MSCHTWTSDQRTTICVLVHFFETSWEDFSTIFNTFHGLLLRKVVISAQYHDLNRKGANIFDNPESAPPLTGISLQVPLRKRDCIKAARDCGIQLVERVDQHHYLLGSSPLSLGEESDYVPNSDSSNSSASPTRAREKRVVALKRQAAESSEAVALKLSAQGIFRLQRVPSARLITLSHSSSFTLVSRL